MNKKVNAIIEKLKSDKLTLAIAESVTCGLAAHKLSTCKGTSDVLAGSIVCYTPDAKKELLGISANLIKRYTPESPEVTAAMIRGLKKIITADVYASLTGLASAGGSERKGKPVGTVFICVHYRNKIFHKRKLFRGSPSDVKEKACLALYDLIAEKTRR